MSPRGAPLDVRADPARLQQIVWNLLLNAVKFSRTGDTVEVVLRQEHADAVLEVRDVGQGIAPEFLPELFQRFRQGDASSTRRHAGLGLGLAIVKNLVEMHGGVVQATSDGLEKGATFTVRLPLAPQEAGEVKWRQRPRPRVVARGLHQPRARRPGGAGGGRRARRPRAAAAFSRIGAGPGRRWPPAWMTRCRCCRHGDRPDIIVSDIGLPDRDGYEFMRQVRRLRGAVADVPAAARHGAVAQRRSPPGADGRLPDASGQADR